MKLKLCVFLMLFVVFMVGCGGGATTTVVAETFAITTDKTTIKVGEFANVSVKSSKTGKAVEVSKFASSDSAVASVNSNGLVTGLTAGDVVITATYNNKDYKVSIKVESLVTTETAIKITSTISIVEVGESVQLQANVADVIWASSNPEVATIDNTGKLTGVKEGATTITITKGDKTDSINISVKKLSDPLKYNSIELTGSIVGGEGVLKTMTEKQRVVGDKVEVFYEFTLSDSIQNLIDSAPEGQKPYQESVIIIDSETGEEIPVNVYSLRFTTDGQFAENGSDEYGSVAGAPIEIVTATDGIIVFGSNSTEETKRTGNLYLLLDESLKYKFELIMDKANKIASLNIIGLDLNGNVVKTIKRKI